MTLDNLVSIKRLKRHEPTPAEIRKLLRSAERNLADAQIASLSRASQFTCAYASIMQAAQVALFANGYRPFSSEGHHMTMVQSLVHSIDLDPARMRVLDTIRHKRNGIDYIGEEPEPAEVDAARKAAAALLDDLGTWLAAHRKDLAGAIPSSPPTR